MLYNPGKIFGKVSHRVKYSMGKEARIFNRISYSSYTIIESEDSFKALWMWTLPLCEIGDTFTPIQLL